MPTIQPPTMHLQNGPNLARGHTISCVVSTAHCSSVKAGCWPERHSRIATLQSPMQGQIFQMTNQGQNPHTMRLQAASVTEPKGSSEKVEWYNKKKELWTEADDVEALKTLLTVNDTGKPLVVDFYAGWCSSCKTAYPALCKVCCWNDTYYRKICDTDMSCYWTEVL